MGCWGRGLLQSDDDHAIASSLDSMLGVPLSSLLAPSPLPSPSSLARQLDAPITANSSTTLLASKLDKVLSGTAPLPHFAPYHPRERIVVVLAVLGMRAGARLEDRHRDALRVLRPALATLEQQVQLVAALDGYKEGVPWVLPRGCSSNSEGFAEEEEEGVDEFQFRGLGHSADEKPTADMCSTSCFSCADNEAGLLRCARCKMARYCSAACQRMDWPVHKRVCVPRAEVRSSPVLPSAPMGKPKGRADDDGVDRAGPSSDSSLVKQSDQPTLFDPWPEQVFALKHHEDETQ
ncbi:hypothetical protein F4775DRAFT_599361 [Biscogniauxia sp. FL1348]|nr:hypothetical protein F4775DRAFT_599361 [Biscogniauxia sp. FL1348]